MLCGANVASATNPVWTAEPGVSGDEAADDDQLDPGSDVADDRRTPQKPHRSVAERQEWVVGHNKLQANDRPFLVKASSVGHSAHFGLGSSPCDDGHAAESGLSTSRPVGVVWGVLNAGPRHGAAMSVPSGFRSHRSSAVPMYFQPWWWTKSWCVEQFRHILFRSVGPSSRNTSSMWWAWVHPGGRSHPGHRHPPSRATIAYTARPTPVGWWCRSRGSLTSLG